MHHAVKFFLGFLFFSVVSASAYAEQDWEKLPDTPNLPEAAESGTADINGIKLWYAVFGEGDPVILVHGGLANSNYWGLQVPVLARDHKVIVLDSRGHGRSSRTEEPISYDLMASDVLALADHLGIKKFALIGWSDGAVIGLNIALHHPDRLTKLFAYGGNSDPSGVKDISGHPAFTVYLERVREEYKALSPTPNDYEKFLANIEEMWGTPDFKADDLNQIKVPTWLVIGDHGIIKESNLDFMFKSIPNSEKLILPGVGHFAFMQRPRAFNAMALEFLRQKPAD